MVNSAGITKDGFLLRMKEEDFEQVMLVNHLREEIHITHAPSEVDTFYCLV